MRVTVAGDWVNEGAQLSVVNVPSYAKMCQNINVLVVVRNAEPIIAATDTSRKSPAVVAVCREVQCCLCLERSHRKKSECHE